MKKIFLFALLVSLFACEGNKTAAPDTPAQAGKPVVITFDYPLFFFTSQIAGAALDVRMPDIEGDPAVWTPDGKDIELLQQADLLILNGAGYESWLAFTSVPAGSLLDTTAHVQDRLLKIEKAIVHQHGPAGVHTHKGTVSTTWLDPQLAIEQTRAVEEE